MEVLWWVQGSLHCILTEQRHVLCWRSGQISLMDIPHGPLSCSGKGLATGKGAFVKAVSTEDECVMTRALLCCEVLYKRTSEVHNFTTTSSCDLRLSSLHAESQPWAPPSLTFILHPSTSDCSVGGSRSSWPHGSVHTVDWRLCFPHQTSIPCSLPSHAAEASLANTSVNIWSMLHTVCFAFIPTFLCQVLPSCVCAWCPCVCRNLLPIQKPFCCSRSH